MLSFYTFFLFINGPFVDNVHMFQLMFSHLCWIRMILKYLIPVKLSIGILPEDRLLEKYGLVEVCLPLQFFLVTASNDRLDVSNVHADDKFYVPNVHVKFVQAGRVVHVVLIKKDQITYIHVISLLVRLL